MRSSGKIDAFERSLGRYDQFEALGTPSVVCARGRMPRGRAEADCASGPVGLSRLPRGRVRARKLALLELSRRPEVERKGGESAYCRTHGRATYENSGCGTGAAARAGSGESLRSSGAFAALEGRAGESKARTGAGKRLFAIQERVSSHKQLERRSKPHARQRRTLTKTARMEFFNRFREVTTFLGFQTPGFASTPRRQVFRGRQIGGSGGDDWSITREKAQKMHERIGRVDAFSGFTTRRRHRFYTTY